VGADITRTSPHGRVRQGLARTWQSNELFDDLSVEENLAVAANRDGWWAQIAESLGRRPSQRVEAHDVLAPLGLDSLAGSPAGELSQGQRKLVGVARALAARPQLVCLDEPAAGLDTAESHQLGRRLRQVVDAGTAMLLVEHDMSLVMGICDHVVVLEFGRVIAAGPPAQIRSDPAVITAYLGASAVAPATLNRQPLEQS
jgi:branched-chain amino acid transport system ATP-binding protein